MKKLILFMLLFVSPAYAANIYVDNTSTSCSTPSDTDYTIATKTCGAGAETVYSTIDAAWDAASAGDTIHVRAGTYVERLTVSKSGSAVGGYITVQPYSSEEVHITGTALGDGTVIYGEDVSYVKIQNFKIHDFTGSGIVFFHDGGHIEINHNEFYNMNASTNPLVTRSADPSCGATGHAILITSEKSEGVHGTITDVTIHGNTVYKAISGCDYENEIITLAYNVSKFLITDNTLNGLGTANSPVTHIGIDLIGKTYTWQGAHIEINAYPTDGIISGNTLYNVGSFPYDASIYLDGAKNVTIELNNVGYAQGVAIAVSTEEAEGITENIIVRKNRIWQSSRGLYFGAATGNTNNSRWAHNTAVMKTQWNTSLGSFLKGTGNKVSNNIFYDHDDTTGLASALMLEQGSTVSGSDYEVTLNYNLYYDPDTSYYKYEDSNYLGFTAYKTGSGQEANSLSSDPLFTDYANNDFTLQTGSPAINAGTCLTTTNDASTGTKFSVVDARWFHDGYGITGVAGDTIMVGTDSVTVTDVDYTNNDITVSGSFTWTSGECVSYTYSGSAPDMGYSEYTSGADTTAPTVPSGLTGTSTGQTTVTLTWTASTDASGIAYYKVYRDTVTPDASDYIGRTTSTEVTYNDTGLTGATHYHYKVLAVDVMNNSSALSDEFTVTTKTNSNLLLNPSFEDGTTEPTSWSKYSDGTMSWAFATGNSSSKAIALTTTVAGTNVQLNQTGVTLADTATYRLSFDAKSSTGHDVAVSIFKNTSPYTNYGLVSTEKNLTTDWQTFTVDFTANATVSDGRLMFWFAPYDANGDVFSIDNTYLEQLTPGDTEAPTQPTSLTATVVSTSRIDLAWTASTDNVAVTGYKVFIDGVDTGNVGTNASSETGLAANTTYTFTVKAYDAQGNMSIVSDSVSATTYKEQLTYTAYKTAETITVNGACDEYSGSNTMTITKSQTPDFSASVKIRWDALHLHICATVNDKFVDQSITTEDADYTVGDSFYVYLRRGSSTYTFAVGAEGGANAKRDELDLDPEQDYTLSFDTTVTTSVGYVVELAIPWGEIGDAPAESSSETLDIVLYDYTDGVTATGTPWNNTDHGVVTNYAGFGSITYGPLPATVNMPTGGKATQMIGDL